MIPASVNVCDKAHEDCLGKIDPTPASRMIISHQYKFIFVCNGRTGTTSIEEALKQYDNSCDMNEGANRLWTNKHIPPAVLKAMLPSQIWQSYFKFVFVRHPLDWFVSQHKHNFRQSGKDFFEQQDIDHLHGYLRAYRGLPLAPSLTQSTYVFDVDGKKIVDYVGRFENLIQNLEEVKSKVGIAFKLDHLNKTTRKPYSECFSEAAANRVRELWRIDFENFDYQ